MVTQITPSAQVDTHSYSMDGGNHPASLSWNSNQGSSAFSSGMASHRRNHNPHTDKAFLNTFTDIEAEKAIVAWLCEGHGLEKIRKHAPDIKSEWFVVMGEVWNTACYLDGKGESINSSTLSRHIEKIGLLNKVGGAEVFVPANMGFGVCEQSLNKLRKLNFKRKESQIGSDLGSGKINATEAIAELLPLTKQNDPVVAPNFTDLSPFLDGTAKQETPTIAQVFDGKSLFYAGRLNEIHAEPGTGKTNVLMASSIAVMESGGSILYIDPEDTPRGFTTRMLLLGASPDDIRDRVKYLHNPSPDEIRIAHAWANNNPPTIVILDGLAESMAAVGANEDKAPDVLLFFRENLRPFADAGSAVVIADHVTKSAEGRGQFARGSGAKAGRYDGVSYEIVMGKSYTPKDEGFVRIKIQKDRNGGVGTRGSIAAELHFIPNANGGTIVAFREPKEKQAGEFRPTGIMDKIVKHLEGFNTANKRELRSLGKSQWVDLALKTLLDDEVIELKKVGCESIYSLSETAKYE
jgi:hypothetical protein